MTKTVTELKRQVAQIQDQINSIQSTCPHKMEVRGLLYNYPSHSTDEKVDSQFCHPRTFFRPSNGIVSRDGIWNFYVHCEICDKKESLCVCDTCLLCLGKNLGEELNGDSIGKPGASVKECLDCHTKFFWYRHGG